MLNHIYLSWEFNEQSLAEFTPNLCENKLTLFNLAALKYKSENKDVQHHLKNIFDHLGTMEYISYIRCD